MAEFALGLTKKAVEGTLIRVKSAIEEEVELKVQVQRDLAFITGEFEMMQSFLNVANAERAKTNVVVRAWVRQLRDLAFDVEDCVEFVVHLDHGSAWTSWLWRLVPPVVICRAPPPSHELDQAIADLRQLKARVVDVSKLEEQALQPRLRRRLIPTRRLLATGTPAASTSGPAAAFRILREAWEAGGRWRGMGDLKTLIRSEGTDLQVISVWGSSSNTGATNLGATYTIKKAYCDPDICREFRSRAWVKVTQPFDQDEFLRSLLTQLYKSFHPEALPTDREYPFMKADRELMQRVNQQRYLVVLEGVSTIVEWDAIRVYMRSSNTTLGSRIVVSTQQLGLALSCTGEPYQVCELRQFADGQSLCAFYSKVHGRRSDVNALSWQLRRCGVIAVWGNIGDPGSTLIGEVFNCISHGHKGFDDVGFKWHNWVDIPAGPFDVDLFSWQLLVNFLSLQSNQIQALVGTMGSEGVVQECRKILRQGNRLVVMNGLQSMDVWDLIKNTFLCEPAAKACILVITKEARVARHCVNKDDQALDIKDLEADWLLRHLIKDCGYRNKEERHSLDEQSLVGTQYVDTILSLGDCLYGPGVISIWGIAGVGKSNLVRYMYDKLMLHQDIKFVKGEKCKEYHYEEEFTAFSWVDVPCPFDLAGFSWLLLTDFYAANIQARENVAVGMMEGQDLTQECRKFLCQEKCLVVIDGLQSIHDWDLIKAAFLSEPTRGCIVVTTNEASVAKHCVDDENRVLNVRSLESHHARDLFGKTAWGRDQYNPEVMEIVWDLEQMSPKTKDKILAEKLFPDDLVDLLELIVAKCGGLPRIIIAIAKYCRIPHKSLLENINSNFMNKLQTDPEFQNQRSLISWMRSYFDACPDSLKPCIFYLSVFPPVGIDIRRRRLLRRWIAEGYSRASGGCTAEEKGEELFSELVNLSIILHPFVTKVLCHVNGFFREYIISQPMEDNLVSVLEGRCSPDAQQAGQHLSISSTWDRDKNLYESIDFSHLRSLTVFGKWKPFLISKDMRLLRVLDLEDTDDDVTDDDLEKIGKLLPRLKFLSLRGCKKVSRLPSSLGGLRHLQTLDIRDTSISTLPSAIMKLHKLQYVRASKTTASSDDGTRLAAAAAEEDGDGIAPLVKEAAAGAPITRPWKSKARDFVASSSSWLSKKLHIGRAPNNVGVKVASGIGKLIDLRTLGVVNLNGARGKAILEELKNLTQLRKLGVSGVNQENWKELCDAISCHGHLESLSVQFDMVTDKQQQKKGIRQEGDHFACWDDISMAAMNIKSLKMHGEGNNIYIRPAMMKQLHNLHKGSLEATIVTQEDIDVVTEWPHREIIYHLVVKPIHDGVLRFAMPPRSEYLELHLGTLKIDCCSRRSLEVSFGDWVVLFVDVLKIHCSSGSSLRISGLNRLGSMKEVWLTGSYTDELRLNLEQQLFARADVAKVLLKLL